MYENIFAMKINQIMVVCKDLQKCMLPYDYVLLKRSTFLPSASLSTELFFNGQQTTQILSEKARKKVRK